MQEKDILIGLDAKHIVGNGIVPGSLYEHDDGHDD